jgi:F-type H+-transporting ATPase subunit gamma
MANLKTLKTRIKSVRSTQKMTKAMKMVAASRLKKSKQLVEHSRPYADKVREMASGLASNVAVKGNFSEKFPLLTGKGKQQKHLIVVVSSDRGLCGGLNSSTVKLTKQTAGKLVSEGREVKLLCLGKKAYEQLKGAYEKQIVAHTFGIFKDIVKYQAAEEVSAQLVELFNKDEF